MMRDLLFLADVFATMAAVESLEALAALCSWGAGKLRGRWR